MICLWKETLKTTNTVMVNTTRKQSNNLMEQSP